MKNQFLEITDPIHDFIRLNSTEQKIVDTSVFQRLRRIKQLSGAHLTYPGAQHTRFEHSLGVMHIAGMAANSLASKKQMPVTDIDDIRLAALLHDIGHGPFSHLFEEVLQKKKRITHEQIGKEIILKSEIGDIISKTTDKKKINRLAVGEGSKQFENRPEGYLVILVDAEGYTKAQTKDLEKEEAGQIYSKVAESGIEEFPGNQITIWTETFDTIQSEFK